MRVVVCLTYPEVMLVGLVALRADGLGARGLGPMAALLPNLVL